jgi:hypothetical protein
MFYESYIAQSVLTSSVIPLECYAPEDFWLVSKLKSISQQLRNPWNRVENIRRVSCSPYGSEAEDGCVSCNNGLEVDDVDSVDAQDDKILRIMDHVRNMHQLEGTDASGLVREDEFRWPDDIDILSSSAEPLQPGGSDMWSLPPLATISSDSHDFLGQFSAYLLIRILL